MTTLNKMYHQLILKFLTFLIISAELTLAVDYEIVIKRDDFLEKCPGLEDKFLDQVYDYSNITVSRDDEDIIHLNGIIKQKYKFDFGDIIEMNLTIYKNVGGKYLQTFTIMRSDLCRVVFAPHEVWYVISEKIPASKRQCPPPNGFQYKLEDFKLNVILKNIQNRNYSGQYRGLLSFKLLGKPQHTCLMVHADSIML